MADKKISALTSLSPVDDDDLIVVVDVSDTTMAPSGTTKKAIKSELKGDKGDDGVDGASIIDAEFSGDDIRFIKDDNTDVILEDAKIELKGEKGDAGVGAEVVTSFGTPTSDEKVPSEKLTKDSLDAKAPLASPTFTGTVTLPTTQLGEASIKLDSVLSADEKWSGITTSGTAGATLAVGDLCYLNADDSRWELVDANLSDGYDKQLGMCILASTDGNATEMLVFGKIRSAAFPAFTVGSPLYISETAGDITHTQPKTADAAIRLVGFALTAEDMLFNPSNDYIVHS